MFDPFNLDISPKASLSCEIKPALDSDLESIAARTNGSVPVSKFKKVNMPY